MSAVGWVVSAGLVAVLVALIWWDRRFTAMEAPDGPWSAPGVTAGAWGHLSPEWPPVGPLRPSVGTCCTCGCWLTWMPADVVDAEFAAITALPARTPDHERP